GTSRSISDRGPIEARESGGAGRSLSFFSAIGSSLRPQVDRRAEETGEKIARRVPPTAHVVGAKEHIRRVLLRFERRMERIRGEERLPPRRSEGPFDRHGRSTCSVEMRDQVKVRVAVIEVERVAGHVEPEEREPEVVRPPGVARSAPAEEVQRRKEERQSANDEEVSHRDRLPLEATVIGMREHLDEEARD